MARNYNTFKLPDKQLLEALTAVATTANIKTPKLSFRLDEQHGQPISCALGQWPQHPEIRQILEAKGSLLGIITMDITEPPYNACSIRIVRSTVSDSVAINLRNDLPMTSAITLVAATQECLKPYERDESFDKLLGDELAEFYRKREQSLVRLEALQQGIIEQNEEYRKKLDQEAQATQDRLKVEYENLSKELQTGYERKDKTIHDREQRLEVRLKEIDDRSSRHARRQIRMDLKDAIAKRNVEFTLTQKTTRKRIIIHAVFLVLVGTLLSILYLCLRYPPTGEGVTEWFHLVRLPLVAAATAAALIYYIRWNDTWFKRHADEEFRTKRFELDVDRASWLVEMAMEWKQEKGTEIPRELLDRLSANLFDKPTEPTDVKHPSEDLLSALLSASAELNLNIPGVGTLRLDRKGARQFKRVAEKKE